MAVLLYVTESYFSKAFSAQWENEEPRDPDAEWTLTSLNSSICGLQPGCGSLVKPPQSCQKAPCRAEAPSAVPFF